MSWTQAEAIELARLVEPIGAAHNCHVYARMQEVPASELEALLT